MKFCLRIVPLLFLVAGTLTQDFDLFDALDDVAPTPAKPKEQPKAPEKPKTDGGFGLDLGDALGPDPTPKPDKPAVKPPSSGGGGFGLDLEDALGPDPNPKPDKPAVKPPKGGGGGGSFDDSDLLDVSGGDYKPEGGRPGGGHPEDPGYNPQGGADQPQEAGSGQIAGIVSAVGVALLGAASSYFAYQKKKLCFKLQGGADPESGKGHQGTQSDPQVFSNLLRTS
ncbi:CD99 molecule isoform X4 [Chelmon rostratus]|uniref:CD99 molecule isoform X4 n=1 Tax=Chelmon rostratus TaxID=109905 RepID=UPI001BE75D17|nr:CD99 molecule isoform X4 [Chelmon rostratus]